MNKLLIIASLFLSVISTAQVGINTITPTEQLDVNQPARLRNLPANGAANSINTKTDGTKSSAQDQTFSATGTLVADNNGVLGTIARLPITNNPGVKAIEYVRVGTLIDANTPVNSVTTLGNLSIRYNRTDTNGGNWIEFMVAVPNNVTAFGHVTGSGGNYSNGRNTVAAANTWYQATGQDLTPGNRDTYDLLISLKNSKEIYRVSLINNGVIPANIPLNIPAVPAQVIIFIEKLQ